MSCVDLPLAWENRAQSVNYTGTRYQVCVTALLRVFVEQFLLSIVLDDRCFWAREALVRLYDTVFSRALGAS